MVGIVLETLVMGSWLVITSSVIARRHCPSNHLKLKPKPGSLLRFAVYSRFAVCSYSGGATFAAHAELMYQL
jgi:hypothetical protein